MKELLIAKKTCDAEVVTCPHCGYDTKAFEWGALGYQDCEACGARYIYHVNQDKKTRIKGRGNKESQPLKLRLWSLLSRFLKQ